jgi:UDP-N-acetylglucosamine--N-acetylmuramyl-(pentapeptide) pyrophosphoryl-undecaprenol N-acetylglucosamine transferase
MTKNNHSDRILVFTGGHHTSALAVANVLRSRGWLIIWLGHRHSQWGDKSDSAEYREVSSSGIKFINLYAGKLYRTYHPLKLLRIPLGFFQALLILLRLKFTSSVGGIVSFGGYISVPVVFAGWLLGIPIITHEQTRIIGWANKFDALFARKIAVTWADSLTHYPKSKVVLTGLPLRPEILAQQKTLGFKKNNLLILGGKQGSHKINTAVFSALPELTKKYIIVHQTGSSTVYDDYSLAEKFKSKKYLPFTYLPPASVSQALAKAEIVVSRSGAHITYELQLFSKKSVLIPISWSSHSEQQLNAQQLVNTGQAVILPESQLNPRNLISAIYSASSLNFRPQEIITQGLENLVHLIESEFGYEK